MVRRWRRYGKDRAYVSVNGADVGYRDLATDAVVCTTGEHAETIAAVTEALAARTRAARYQPRHASPDDDGVQQPASPTHSSSAPIDPVRSRSLLPDVDLAGNAPGHAIRVHAEALRDAAPLRTAVARVFNINTDERRYRIGADAEVEVARRLAKLGPNWRALHSIPVGTRGSDIDHLVVGPAGVFTINTKHHPTAHIWVRGDTFKVNGQNQRYVPNSRFEAARAARQLSRRAGFDVDVTGLIAVMGATGGFIVKDQPPDGKVVVVRRKDVARYLGGLPEVLGAASIDRIYDVARHLATWQPELVAWGDF